MTVSMDDDDNLRQHWLFASATHCCFSIKSTHVAATQIKLFIEKKQTAVPMHVGVQSIGYGLHSMPADQPNIHHDACNHCS